MKRLKQYIHSTSLNVVESEYKDELTEISDWISTLNDMTGLFDKISNSSILGGGDDDDENINDRTKRYVGIILKRLLNDPEIIAWYDSPYENTVKLKALLAKKLSAREIQYMDEICRTLTDMSGNDNDADIVNNAIMKLIDDPDMEKWFKKTKKSTEKGQSPSEFELRKIINGKLDSREKRFSEPIVRKFLRILNNDYENDDYYNNDSSKSTRNYR